MSGDLALLVAAAREAGEVALRHWRADPKVWHKPAGAGPVTEADLEVDEAIRATLAATRPDIGWMSEESDDPAARAGARRIFIVDPIDGTRAFVKGNENWSHSLALCVDGRITAAVVYLPARDKLYAARKGGGAFLNDAPIRVNDSESLDGARLLSPRSTLAAHNWRGTPPAFEHHLRPSLAYRLALVGEGRFDAMVTLNQTWEWDVAAGALIMTEAGGRVTDRLGYDPKFNNPDPRIDGILAAGPKRVESLLAALTPLGGRA